MLSSDTIRSWLADTVTSAITTAAPLLRYPGLSAAHYHNPTHHSAITKAGPLRSMSSHRHDTHSTLTECESPALRFQIGIIRYGTREVLSRYFICAEGSRWGKEDTPIDLQGWGCREFASHTRLKKEAGGGVG